jgi:DNA-binding response OmpR family regulator
MMNDMIRILLVENYDDTRRLLEFVLEESGYTVTSRATLLDAITSLKSEQFDLFVLDGRLSDGTGMELCQRIRETDDQTPIIFCSTDGHHKQADLAMAAGAQAYLIKPFELEKFRETIRELVSAKHNGKDASIRQVSCG